MLDPSWMRKHPAFDLFHIQFGFDARGPEQLADLVAALEAEGKPLVYTVHDLRNPHHLVRDEHDAQLDVLVPAADALITLTPGAAHEIKSRWGRDAIVLPHPHVVDLERLAMVPRRRRLPGPGGEGFRVGLHVKSLRACMDPLTILPALIEAVQQIPGAVLQVDGHTDVLDPGGDRYARELAEALRAAPPCVEVRIHDFFSDDQLWDYLAGLDVSVLPYRFGTHSGWLEACRDLGTAVVAPSCGYYDEQGQVSSFVMDETSFDEASLVAAIHDAYGRTPVEPLSLDERVAQRQQIAAAHLALYAELLGA